MARVVVEVMPKPEILDPQGKAVTGALARLGFAGLTVRQGKMFEIEVDGELDEARLAQIEDAAEKLLANTVIEDFVVHRVPESVAEEAADGAEAPAEADQTPVAEAEPTEAEAEPTAPAEAEPGTRADG